MNKAKEVFENRGEGWEVKKLGDVCEIQLGKTPSRSNTKYWDVGKSTGNVWLSIADLKHGETINDSKEYVSDLGFDIMNITPKGTLMISFKLTIGRTCFAGRDLCTNEAIASLIDLDNGILKKYLFYYFSFYDWNKETEGDFKVKGKTLNKSKLKELPILIPPLPEQKRIVSILDKAFADIDQAQANTEQNLNNLEELKQSILQKMFNGELT